jgi:hypothetical protein
VALDFLQDLGKFVGTLLSLHFIVDDQHRRLTARAYTATFFQCDLSVGCGLSQLDVQHLFGFFNQLWHTGYVAGGSQTKLDRMFAARLRFEE